MLLLPLLWACETEEAVEAPACALTTPVATPTTAAPGDVVTLSTGPLTETWDTLVAVGGASALVGDVVRTDCDECDECYTDVGLGACESCASSCATCVETVDFTVPDLAPGTWTVDVVNRHGRSPPVDLVVTEAADTGA